MPAEYSDWYLFLEEESLISVNYPNRLELVELEDLLSQYYEKNGEADKQVDTLMNKLELYTEVYEEAHKNTLKMKRSIVTVLMKQKKHDTAIKMLEDIRVGILVLSNASRRSMERAQCMWRRL
jgi:hypothetical protein